MKAYFAWKQLKADYSKIIQKEKSRGHGFVCLFVGYISIKKIIENCNSVGAGAHNVGKVVPFWLKFDPNFTNITGIYLLKVNNRNTRTRCEICSKLTIKIPERRQWL